MKLDEKNNYAPEISVVRKLDSGDESGDIPDRVRELLDEEFECFLDSQLIKLGKQIFCKIERFLGWEKPKINLKVPTSIDFKTSQYENYGEKFEENFFKLEEIFKLLSRYSIFLSDYIVKKHNTLNNDKFSDEKIDDIEETISKYSSGSIYIAYFLNVISNKKLTVESAAGEISEKSKFNDQNINVTVKLLLDPINNFMIYLNDVLLRFFTFKNLLPKALCDSLTIFEKKLTNKNVVSIKPLDLYVFFYELHKLDILTPEKSFKVKKMLDLVYNICVIFYNVSTISKSKIEEGEKEVSNIENGLIQPKKYAFMDDNNLFALLSVTFNLSYNLRNFDKLRFDIIDFVEGLVGMKVKSHVTSLFVKSGYCEKVFSLKSKNRGLIGKIILSNPIYFFNEDSSGLFLLLLTKNEFELEGIYSFFENKKNKNLGIDLAYFIIDNKLVGKYYSSDVRLIRYIFMLYNIGLSLDYINKIDSNEKLDYLYSLELNTICEIREKISFILSNDDLYLDIDKNIEIINQAKLDLTYIGKNTEYFSILKEFCDSDVKIKYYELLEIRNNVYSKSLLFRIDRNKSLIGEKNLDLLLPTIEVFEEYFSNLKSKERSKIMKFIFSFDEEFIIYLLDNINLLNKKLLCEDIKHKIDKFFIEYKNEGKNNSKKCIDRNTPVDGDYNEFVKSNLSVDLIEIYGTEDKKSYFLILILGINNINVDQLSEMFKDSYLEYDFVFSEKQLSNMYDLFRFFVKYNCQNHVIDKVFDLIFLDKKSKNQNYLKGNLDFLFKKIWKHIDINNLGKEFKNNVFSNFIKLIFEYLKTGDVYIIKNILDKSDSKIEVECEEIDEDICNNVNTSVSKSIKPLKRSELMKKLRSIGYTDYSEGGDHSGLSNTSNGKKIPFSRCGDGNQIPVGTIAQIIKTIGITKEEWNSI